VYLTSAPHDLGLENECRRPEKLQNGTFTICCHATMNSLLNKVRFFLESEDGPTAVEYAVMLSLIVVVCLNAITTIGTRANSIFSKVANSL
jgi:pilus assembly protein Flp/PilA